MYTSSLLSFVLWIPSSPPSPPKVLGPLPFSTFFWVNISLYVGEVPSVNNGAPVLIIYGVTQSRTRLKWLSSSSPYYLQNLSVPSDSPATSPSLCSFYKLNFSLCLNTIRKAVSTDYLPFTLQPAQSWLIPTLLQWADFSKSPWSPCHQEQQTRASPFNTLPRMVHRGPDPFLPSWLPWHHPPPTSQISPPWFCLSALHSLNVKITSVLVLVTDRLFFFFSIFLGNGTYSCWCICPYFMQIPKFVSLVLPIWQDFPRWLRGKESACQCGSHGIQTLVVACGLQWLWSVGLVALTYTGS